MSSLWTPGGEHQIPREGEPPAGRPAAPPTPPPGDGGPPPGAADQEMAEIAAQLLAAPVEDVIANHCFGLFELAALHLSQQPPNLEAARGAIDAMGLLVDGLAGRLGVHQATLTEGLNQLRLAWVKIAETAGRPDGADAATTPPSSGD